MIILTVALLCMKNEGYSSKLFTQLENIFLYLLRRKKMTTKLIKGSEIPHLVDPQFAHYTFTPEEVAEMEAMDASTSLAPAAEKLLKQQLQSAVKAERARKKAINIRLFETDIVKFKKMAQTEGIPYQTLIASVLHKVANKTVSVIIK